jgi:hypothetical protein
VRKAMIGTTARIRNLLQCGVAPECAHSTHNSHRHATAKIVDFDGVDNGNTEKGRHAD